MIVIALVSGILVGFVALALRRDTKRARSVRESGGLVDDRFVFLSLPGFALLMVGFAGLGLAIPLSDTVIGVILIGVTGLVAAIGAVTSVWGLFASSVPRFAQPRWMRQ